MRSVWLTLPLLLPAAVQAQKFDPKYAGTYRTVVHDKKTGAELEKNVSAGQLRMLRLDKTGKWSWRDQFAGFDGTWTSNGPDLIFRTINGPSGALKNAPPMRLKASKNGKVLTIIDAKLPIRVEMVWDPTIETRLRRKYKEELKRNGG